MQEKRFLLMLTMVFVFIGFLWAGGAQETEAERTGIKDFYTITTATTGGSFYPTGVALAQLWSEQLGDKLGTRFSAQTSAGSPENVDILDKNEAEIAYMQNNVVLWAYRGTNMFEGKPHKNFRLILPMFSSTYHFMVDKNINSLSALRGKRFVVGRPGSGTETSSRLVLEALGISYDDIKAEFLGQSEGLEALRNGQVDGVLAVGGHPISAVSDIMATPTRRFKMLNVAEDELQKINKAEPWMIPTEIPADTYPNQTTPIRTLKHMVFLLVKEDMNPEVVYQIVKTTWENMDWLRESHGAFNRMSIDLADEDFFNFEVPVHEGAKRYYREIGKLKD